MTILASFGEALATLWTVWAVLLFAGIGYWAWRPRNRQRFDRDAHIPLNDEQ
jgi:cytochrome c oxidase cbb3-type subunit 4